MLAVLTEATVEEIAFEGYPGLSWSGIRSRLRARGLALDRDLCNPLWTELFRSKYRIILRDASSKAVLDPSQRSPFEQAKSDIDLLLEEIMTSAPQRPSRRLGRKASLEPDSGSEASAQHHQFSRRLRRKTSFESASAMDSGSETSAQQRPSRRLRAKTSFENASTFDSGSEASAPQRSSRRHRVETSFESTSAEDSLLLDVEERVRAHYLHLGHFPQFEEGKPLRRIVQALARHRYDGCKAPQLGRELGMDTKDLLYHLEGLRYAGVVAAVYCLRQRGGRVSSGSQLSLSQSGAHGNLFFHIRFYDPARLEAQQSKDLFTLVLRPLSEHLLAEVGAATHQVIFEHDLRSLARKFVEQYDSFASCSGRLVSRMYQSARQELCDGRQLECVRVWDRLTKTLRDAVCLHGAHLPEALKDADEVLALQDQPSEALPGSSKVLALQDQPSEALPGGPAPDDVVHEEVLSQEAAGEKAHANDGHAAGEQAPDDVGDEEEVFSQEEAGEKAHANDGHGAGYGQPGSSARIRERSLPQQALDLIEVSSVIAASSDESKQAKGITSPELSDLLGLQRKPTERILGQLHRDGRAVRLLESDGRTHVNRYVHADYAAALSAEAGTQDACPSPQTMPARDDSPAAQRDPAAQSPEAQRARRSRGQPRKEEQLHQVRTVRIHATFERRLERAGSLLEELGVLTPLDLQRGSAHDVLLQNKGTPMDRKSSFRLLEALDKRDLQVGLTRDSEKKIKFAYWRPSLTEEEASARFRIDAKRRCEARLSALRCNRKGALAIADHAAEATDGAGVTDSAAPAEAASALVPVEQMAAEVMAASTERRCLSDVAMREQVQSGTSVVRQDQKIMVFYGFQVPVMSRVQVLHRQLLDQLSFDHAAPWVPQKVVEDMDLQAFLQIIGCGVRVPKIEELLSEATCLPKVCDLPSEVQDALMSKLYSGASRSILAMRKLLTFLMKLGLVATFTTDLTEKPTSPAVSSAPVQVHVKYQLVRQVTLEAMTGEDEGAPQQPGTFDFAEPLAFDMYWKMLRDESHAWMKRRLPVDQKGDSDGESRGSEADDEDAKGLKELAHIQPAIEMPVGYTISELFYKRSWARKESLTPQQRAKIDALIEQVQQVQHITSAARTSSEQDAECSALAVRGPPRILNVRSPEVLALSRHMRVAPDRIIKYCLHKTDICGVATGSPVVFSLLHLWRYCCHICHFLCYQRNAIVDHYDKVHDAGLPEDERVFSRTEVFTQQQREQNAKTSQKAPHDTKENLPRRRRRRRKRIVDSSEEEPFVRPLAGEKKRQRIAASPENDESLLRLYATAELLAAQRSVGGEAVVQADAEFQGVAAEDSEVWSLLAELTGDSSKYCANRLSRLLTDVKNRRTLVAFRIEIDADAQDAKVEHPSAAESLSQCGARALARVLVLTPYHGSEPWWRQDFLSPASRDFVDDVYRQWQGEGLVCKYKSVHHSVKLPAGSKPRYMLTWQARSRLFGRAIEHARWHEARKVCRQVTGSGPAAPIEVEQSEVTGPMVMALVDLVVHEKVVMTPVWSDAPEFYSMPEEEQPAPTMPEASQAGDDRVDSEDIDGLESPYGGGDEESDDADKQAGGHAAKVSGVHAHLKGTQGVPSILSTRIEACGGLDDDDSGAASRGLAAELLKWLLVSDEEFEQLCSLGGVPLDPLLTTEAEAEAEAAAEAEASGHPVEAAQAEAAQVAALSSPDAAGQAEAEAEAAAEAEAEAAQPAALSSPDAAGQDLQSCPKAHAEAVGATERDLATDAPPEVWQLGGCSDLTVHASIVAPGCDGAEADVELLRDAAYLLRQVLDTAGRADRRPSGQAEEDRIQLPVQWHHHAGLPAARVGDLRQAFETRRMSQVALDGCSGDSAQARFSAALARLEEMQLLVPLPCGDDFCEVIGAAAAPYCIRIHAGAAAPPEILRDFLKSGCVGYHWGCRDEAGVSDALTTAMIQAAGVTGSAAALKRLKLPAGMVAPAAWVDAQGSFNTAVLRCILLGLLMQLLRAPGCTAQEIALNAGLLEACEVDLMMDLFLAAGLVIAQEPCQAAAPAEGSAQRSPGQARGSETRFFAQPLAAELAGL